MLGSDFHFRDKIGVAILGATGCVGQKFVELLATHPWFEIKVLAASERSVGKPYSQAMRWLVSSPLPVEIGELVVQNCHSDLPCSVVFSSLEPSVAGEIETRLAKAGYLVVSNSRHHRIDPQVPLIIPEINPSHLALLDLYKRNIVTNPNCSAVGLTLALKPLFDAFGIEAVTVTTLQAISGAGYPGLSALDIQDNVIPFIHGEEEKLQTEPLKILGVLQEDHIKQADFIISAQCNRVAVTDGHLLSVSVKLRQKPQAQDIIEAWRSFRSEPQELTLPSAPQYPLHYFHEEDLPQPKLQRSLERGMAVSIGRLRPCPLLDFKFTILSHNTIRGAAGSAILNAEMLVRKGYIYW